MDEEYLVTGPVRTVTVEQVELVKTPFSWREGDRRFIGRLIFNGKGLPAEKKTPEETTLWIRDPDGQLVREETLGPDSQPLSVKEYSQDHSRGLLFEKAGEIITARKITPGGEILQEQRFRGEILEMVTDTVLTPDGKPFTREYKEGNGRFLRRESFEYDNRGRLRSRRCLNDSGVVILHDLFEYPLEYGGNWLKRIRYSVREEGHRIREVPAEILYRDIITDRVEESADAGSVREGVLSFPDGTYRGEIRRDLMHGQGVLSFEDGSRYEGSFNNGIMEGKGIFTWADGRRYEGDFRGGRMEGTGTCRWPGGDEYKGQFRNGMMHGIGTFTWQNGNRFTGLFENNNRTDQGLIEPEKPSNGQH